MTDTAVDESDAVEQGSGQPSSAVSDEQLITMLADRARTDVSKQTISTITDKVMDGMAEWQNRPLDRA
jgi:transposase-like protein